MMTKSDFTKLKASLRGLSLLLLFWSPFVLSQEPTPASKPIPVFSFQYCTEEKKSFCSEKEQNFDIGRCLFMHRTELSKECQQDLERFAEFRKQATARGGGALGAFGGLNAVGPPVPLIGYDFRYSPGVSSATVGENKANISAPVYHAGADTVAMSLAGSDLHFGAPITLSSGTVVPQDLYRAEIGAQYFHQLPDNRNWGLRASFGYAGDQPLRNPAEAAYSLNCNYGMPSAGGGYWIFSLFISNNNPLLNNVPIPGVGYLYESENFTGLFGFPVTAFQWTPVYPWAFSFALFGPTVQVEAVHGELQDLQYFFGFYWTRQSYILSQFTDPTYRLTLQEMRSSVGLRKALMPNLFGELQIGRSFDRSVYAGSGLSDQSGGAYTLLDDWYGSISLRQRF